MKLRIVLMLTTAFVAARSSVPSSICLTAAEPTHAARSVACDRRAIDRPNVHLMPQHPFDDLLPDLSRSYNPLAISSSTRGLQVYTEPLEACLPPDTANKCRLRESPT